MSPVMVRRVCSWMDVLFQFKLLCQQKFHKVGKLPWINTIIEKRLKNTQTCALICVLLFFCRAGTSWCLHQITMQCSWKSLVLLALASIAIQYTAIRTFSTKPLSLLCSVGLVPASCTTNCSFSDVIQKGQETLQSCGDVLPHTSSIPVPPAFHNGSKRTNILILATTRSGSSFVGQLFNQHPEVSRE